jgi:hypothetical protein
MFWSYRNAIWIRIAEPIWNLQNDCSEQRAYFV